MSLYTEDLQAVVVADGDPVGLRGGPLHVVDLPFGRVGQDGVLDGPGHLLDVPDQGLVVVRCGGGKRRETFTPVYDFSNRDFQISPAVPLPAVQM